MNSIIKPQSSQRLRKVRKAFTYTQNFAPFAVKKFCFDNMVGWGTGGWFREK
jgi:hypothetical protein